MILTGHSLSFEVTPVDTSLWPYLMSFPRYSA